ncbi:hypothetical protein D3C78_718600 [compost metagenome]
MAWAVIMCMLDVVASGMTPKADVAEDNPLSLRERAGVRGFINRSRNFPTEYGPEQVE